MGDPYSRLFVSADKERGFPRPSFPGYLSSDRSSSAFHNSPSSTDKRVGSSDVIKKYKSPLQPGGHGIGNLPTTGLGPEPSIGGVSAGTNAREGQEDPKIVGERQDAIRSVSPAIPEVTNERPSSLRHADGPPVNAGASNVLFVDGLPRDCTRREVSHLFRPFIGFQDIKVVFKEPRHKEDRELVLCFVEFINAKCAQTAMEALKGYKFDYKKPDSPVLRIQFAHFPFRLASDSDGQHLELPH